MLTQALDVKLGPEVASILHEIGNVCKVGAARASLWGGSLVIESERPGDA